MLIKDTNQVNQGKTTNINYLHHVTPLRQTWLAQETSSRSTSSCAEWKLRWLINSSASPSGAPSNWLGCAFYFDFDWRMLSRSRGSSTGHELPSASALTTPWSIRLNTYACICEALDKDCSIVAIRCSIEANYANLAYVSCCFTSSFFLSASIWALVLRRLLVCFMRAELIPLFTVQTYQR